MGQSLRVLIASGGIYEYPCPVARPKRIDCLGHSQ